MRSWNMVKIKNSYYAYLPADKILRDVVSTVTVKINEIVDDLDSELQIRDTSSEDEEKELVKEIVEQKNSLREAYEKGGLLEDNDDMQVEYLEDSNFEEVDDNTKMNYKPEKEKGLKRVRKGTSKPNHTCSQCSFSCGTMKFMRLHLLREHNIVNRIFKCPDCDLSFGQKCILKAHHIRKHTSDFHFGCTYCGKMYKVKGDLKNHVRYYHEEKGGICDICGKSCSNSNSLYTHKRRIHNRPDFECSLCNRAMVTQENLDRHLLSQHSRFICEECGKTFSSKTILQRHIDSVHHNVKKYACQFCSRNFSRQTHLRQHMLIHTGKRIFNCDICNKTFTQKSGLITHRKLHPGEHPPLPTFRLDEALHELMKK